MNAYSVLTLAALIFYVQIGIVVLKKKRDRINWIVAVLALYMALYAVYQLFLYSPSSKETVTLVNSIFQALGCASITVGLFSLFVLEIATKAWKRPYRIAAGILIALTALVFAVEGVFQETIVSSFEFKNGLWFERITPISASGIAYIVFVYVNFFFVLASLIFWYATAPTVRERCQARSLLAVSIAVMAVHGGINYVLPFLWAEAFVPRITAICFLPVVFTIWYAIDKFHFLADIPKAVERNRCWRLLTRREREILSSLRRGNTAKQIGEMLFIAESTVRKHIENMRAKTGSRSQVELLYKIFSEDPPSAAETQNT